jgi:hypothetical protein
VRALTSYCRRRLNQRCQQARNPIVIFYGWLRVTLCLCLLTLSQRSNALPLFATSVLDQTSESTPQTSLATIQESATVTEAARETVRTFLDAYDRSDSDAAWSHFAARTQEVLPLRTWHDTRASFFKMSGRAIGHEIKDVSWLRNPPNAESPGLYAVFKISCRYEELKICSEIVILYAATEGSPFTVLRHDRYAIDSRSLQKLCANRERVDIDLGGGQAVQIQCSSKPSPPK